MNSLALPTLLDLLSRFKDILIYLAYFKKKSPKFCPKSVNFCPKIAGLKLTATEILGIF